MIQQTLEKVARLLEEQLRHQQKLVEILKARQEDNTPLKHNREGQ